jgi:hypothetical protein
MPVPMLRRGRPGVWPAELAGLLFAGLPAAPPSHCREMPPAGAALAAADYHALRFMPVAFAPQLWW